MSRTIKKSIKRVAVIVVVAAIVYFFPIPFVVLVLCGIWDVSRNRGLEAGVIRLYFLRNGIGTWLASPLNILLDIFALPFINKGVYELDDLPVAYRDEIRGLLDEADRNDLAGRLKKHTDGMPRAMCFFKWYGKNIDASIDIPAFHKEYKFIRTIGASIFRERESTSRHFGPFRPSLRVLYCLNEVKSQDAYIKVGPVENHWMDNRLFIFDDTLLHQSFNETDEPRSCLFVDIIRPSYVPFIFDLVISMISGFFKGINGVFYRNWKMVTKER